MMTEREARKPWRKLSSDTMEPCSASSSAGDSDLSSAACPSPLIGSAGSLSARTKEKKEKMEKRNTTARLTLFMLLVWSVTWKLTNKVENSSYSQISDVHNFTSVSFLIPVPVLC